MSPEGGIIWNCYSVPAGFAFGINSGLPTMHISILNSNIMPSITAYLPAIFLPSHWSVLHVHPHILMTLALHMPLVAAGRQGYRNSLCFQGCLRRSTDSHVLRATWHELLDGCKIGWTEKPVWVRPNKW